MNKSLQTTVHLWRHFGPGWLMFRAGYALRRRSGLMRRSLPASSWDAQPLSSFLSDPSLAEVETYVARRAEQCVPFLFDAADREKWQPYFKQWDIESRSPSCIADALRDGVFRFFEHHTINLGCPPNWHLHPVTGQEYPADRHWSEIGDFDGGDIKYVWEPSRFAWVYPLVRAYWRTGHERDAKLFWQLVEDWHAHNPPQHGVNWKCGQEVALRVMACCFGLYGFADSVETTPARVAMLAQLLAVSGQRIEVNLSYALSQQNNHGISEATGLWTLGLLFPEFKSAKRWRQLGRKALEDQCRKLIDADGAFSQHSVNYQRVMLHACLWSIRLGDLHGQPLSDEMQDRVSRAGEFLWQLQDDATGRLPRHGAHDGALVLPLSNCEADDYRPVVQSSHWLRNRKRGLATGPWDEELLWLCGTEAMESPVEERERHDWQGHESGYSVLRTQHGHLTIRAGSFRHRPAHADMLHADIWWRGQNMAIDAGTFSYNAAPPWDTPLARTGYHNTVTVDGRDQMDRVGRFLWLPWLSGQQSPIVTSEKHHLAYWEGTHDGYQRLSSPVRHRRGILRVGNEHWLVVDSLHSDSSHAYRLHWLLKDVPYELDEPRHQLRLKTPRGPYDIRIAANTSTEISCVRADPDSARGWFAPHYGTRRPAISLACLVEEPSVTFWTLLGPSITGLKLGVDQVMATTDQWSCRVRLSAGATSKSSFDQQHDRHGHQQTEGLRNPTSKFLIDSVSLTGDITDQWTGATGSPSRN
ncbi:MAG: alginate lyase family protein [Planctomycetaceae bacterium]|nr:alginate lyase family protein [Planctomycetaceae bacterium]